MTPRASAGDAPLTTIALRTARRLAVHAQGLDGGWRMPAGKEGAAQAVERLGYVQIDTIAVVRRAHHHTIWARCPDYRPGMLHDLQAHDRRVFEYWTHAASYVPMRDYRYYLGRMRWGTEHGRAGQWLRANRKLADRVLARIRGEGALAAADFEDTRAGKRRPWWDWKPAKQALEALFSTGELMIAERRNFQRVYDLAERVLPADVDTATPDPAEQARFRARRLLATRGIALPGAMHWSVRAEDEALQHAVSEMVEAGEAAMVRVRGLGDGHYADARLLDVVRGRRRSKCLHLLSPFDSLVIWRPWLNRLFGFDYTLECYTPAAKRRWGYFCLPILWGDEFVGRLDPKADRKARVLIVRKVMLEARLGDDALVPALAAKLRDLAAFNDCDRVKVEKVQPAGLAAPLRKELADGA